MGIPSGNSSKNKKYADESTNREKVLKKVRGALLSKTANPFPNLDFETTVFPVNDLPAEVNFAEKFMQHGGNFILCDSSIEVIEMLLALCEQNAWKKIVCSDKKVSEFLNEFEFPFQSSFDFVNNKMVDAVIVSCLSLISRTGEIIFTPVELSDEKLFSVAQNIVVVTNVSHLKNDLKEALLSIKEKNDKKLFPFLSIINPKSFEGQIFTLVNQEEKASV